MSKFNISKVDVKLLTIFCAVYEQGSISLAAQKLDLSQPLVSHALERLRQAFNDPLFVRAGRSIAPTERAHFLAPQISVLVEKLIDLSEPNPGKLSDICTCFAISANDFERQLIIPQLLKTVLREAPKASLNLSNTKEHYIECLRQREYDIVITPLQAADQSDIYSKPLFTDQARCFFDSSQISSAEVIERYAQLDHGVVQFGSNKAGLVDKILNAQGIVRNIKLTTPSFEALPSLIRDTQLIATVPSRLQHSLFAGFGSTALPFDAPDMAFNMIWHKATHLSPPHQWLRSVIQGLV
jgi:DNA-binding transcriptional LysR family regulator